jgi:leucyl aminopeptidase
MQDMTAFLARNATKSIGFIKIPADAAITNRTVKLSKECVSIPAEIYELARQVDTFPFHVDKNS